MLPAFLMLATWVVLAPLAAAVTVPWALLSGKIRLMYAAGMGIARAGLRTAGLRIQAEGREWLEKEGTYIYLSNHASNLDPPVLLPLIPRRTSVLVKKELFRIPLLGQAMRIARLIPVNRTSRESAVGSLHQAADVLRDGISMTIFVEGTRSPDGRLLPFKKGPFHLAMNTGVPVVPVTIAGTFAAQPKGTFAIRRVPIRVVFHEPLDPRRFPHKEALLEAVRDRIGSALPSEDPADKMAGMAGIVRTGGDDEAEPRR
jgi:1-acyl-sn-glycerol-3-phosphate acyltransferase